MYVCTYVHGWNYAMCLDSIVIFDLFAPASRGESARWALLDDISPSPGMSSATSDGRGTNIIIISRDVMVTVIVVILLGPCVAWFSLMLLRGVHTSFVRWPVTLHLEGTGVGRY